MGSTAAHEGSCSSQTNSTVASSAGRISKREEKRRKDKAEFLSCKSCPECRRCVRCGHATPRSRCVRLPSETEAGEAASTKAHDCTTDSSAIEFAPASSPAVASGSATLDTDPVILSKEPVSWRDDSTLQKFRQTMDYDPNDDGMDFEEAGFGNMSDPILISRSKSAYEGPLF